MITGSWMRERSIKEKSVETKGVLKKDYESVYVLTGSGKGAILLSRRDRKGIMA